jgi:hypothetical protein
MMSFENGGWKAKERKKPDAHRRLAHAVRCLDQVDNVEMHAAKSSGRKKRGVLVKQVK